MKTDNQMIWFPVTPWLHCLLVPPSGGAGAPHSSCCWPSSAVAPWLLRRPELSSPPGTPAGLWDHRTSLTSPYSAKDQRTSEWEDRQVDTTTGKSMLHEVMGKLSLRLCTRQRVGPQLESQGDSRASVLALRAPSSPASCVWRTLRLQGQTTEMSFID